MSNELCIANETISALDKAAENGLVAQREVSAFKKMALVAGAIGELRNLLTPKVMAPIMALQNTSIGFKTDNPAGYPLEVVRDCLIEATLKGVYPVGNEFNIISRQCYITKEGYFHKLRDIPNFGWTEVPGIPVLRGDYGAIIKVKLEWTHNKKSGSTELELAIRVNKGMGADAIVGKAIRKARAWLFSTITGQDIGDGDVEDEAIDVPPGDIRETASPFEKPPAPEAAPDELPM